MMIESEIVITRYIAATVIQISNAIKVSEIISNPDVVRSNTAITLTIAECLMRLTRIPARGGRIMGKACGRVIYR